MQLLALARGNHGVDEGEHASELHRHIDDDRLGHPHLNAPGMQREERRYGCGLGFATMLHRYYHFPSGVSFFQIPDCLRDITQWVAPVDDRNHFSALKELSHDEQVISARMRQKREQLLAHEP